MPANATERAVRGENRKTIKNDIYRTNKNGQLPNSAREEFRTMLKICETLRDNTKTLLKANVTS